MVQIAVLLVNADGEIIEASQGAVDFFGRCVGRLCCEIVRGKTPSRIRFCVKGCPATIAANKNLISTTAIIRDHMCRLMCVRLGNDVAIAVLPTNFEPVIELLTPREREVLALVAEGQTSAVIAEALGIRPATVRTHVEHARQKLGATTRAEAVARAIATGQI